MKEGISRCPFSAYFFTIYSYALWVFVEEAGDAGKMDFGTYKEISAEYSLNSFSYFQTWFQSELDYKDIWNPFWSCISMK